MAVFWAVLSAAAAPPVFGDAAGGWWRAAAGMIVVGVLLVLCLRFLRRWPGARGHDAARVEAVWPLGPRREIHVVRLGDEVHYVYRNEQGMVLLRHESWDAFRKTHAGLRAGAAAPLLSGSLRSLWHRADAVIHRLRLRRRLRPVRS